MNSEVQYEYRPMKRFRERLPNGISWGYWSEWELITTYSGKGKAYGTLGGAKSIATREKGFDQRFQRKDQPERQWEYKVQRRPVELGWEDV